MNIKTYNNFKYYIDENGCVHITEYITKIGTPVPNDGVVEIPSVIDDCPVTNIDRLAFRYCNGVRKVIIPDSVKNIDNQAFGEYDWVDAPAHLVQQLLRLINSSEMNFISYKDKSGAERIKTETAPDPLYFFEPVLKKENEKIIITYTDGKAKEFDSVSCFSGDSTIKKVEINGNHDVTYDAFYGCENLETVIIKGSSRIFSFAFANCKKLKTVIFYKNPSFHDYVSPGLCAEESVFAGCERLSKIEFKGKADKTHLCKNLLSKKGVDTESWRREISENDSRGQSDLNFWNGFHL